MKTVERAHQPARWWDQIPLSEDTAQAQAQIAEHLQFWKPFLRERCKERLARIHEYQARMAKMQESGTGAIMTAVKDKTRKREKRREDRARTVANLEGTIERELVERLKKGVYGEMYNVSQSAFDAAITKSGGKTVALEEESQDEYDRMAAYIDAESEEEGDWSEEEEESQQDIEDLAGSTLPPPPPAKKRARNLEIEYERQETRQLARK